ncbi:MAG TPA: c-type cytochrome [Bryobacteraceae bacterium]|jgi:mono/diheme cytochrome c family protein|nr:c-type cytochrome [Bryobacteraceae bacterium]
MRRFIFLLCFAATTFAQGPQQPQRPARGADRTREFLGLGPAPDAAAAALGEPIYTRNCAFCHGPKARGGEGPNLIQSALVLHDEKGEEIGKVVHGGRLDRGMPAFPSLTDAQLYDIAEFLHQQVYQAANRGTYKLLNIVTGNAAAGAAYFNGAGQCNTCHSVTGDLAHIGSKLQPADLQQAFLYPASVGDTKTPSKVVVTFPTGKTITGNLVSVDDFEVTLVDEAGVPHSLVLGNGTKVEVENKLARHLELLKQYTDADMHNLTAYLATLK